MARTRLSKPQREVLELLATGAWELGHSTYTGHYWMQRGGLGKGGEMRKVRTDVAYALWKKGYIEEAPAGPNMQSYGITGAGLAAVFLIGVL